MKIFLSYRREDTGGRAGRLFDVLAARYGARNVFQDVTSATPGRDFVAGLDGAIASSDVMLVVIGPNWVGRSPDGTRRVDRTDDFVRNEVGSALAADIAVVPVLVDGGELPAGDELPDELAPIVRRQAVPVRDETWHQDVDALIRRLEGDLLADAGPRRRWPIAMAAVLVVATAAVVGVVLTRDGGGGDGADGGDDSSADSGETPTCPARDEAWSELDTVPAAPINHSYASQGAEIEATVVGAWSRYASGGSPTVLVDVDVANLNPAAEGIEDEIYVGIGDIDGLVVGGYDQGPAVCMQTSTDPQLEPDERTVATIGFDSTVDPAGVSVILEAFDDVDLVVSEPAGG